MSAPLHTLAYPDVKLLLDRAAGLSFAQIGKDLGLPVKELRARHKQLIAAQEAEEEAAEARPEPPAAAAAAATTLPPPPFAVGDRVRFKTGAVDGCFTVTGGAPGKRAAVSINTDDGLSLVAYATALEKVPPAAAAAAAAAGSKRKADPKEQEQEQGGGSPKKAKSAAKEEGEEEAIAALLAQVPKSKQMVKVIRITEQLEEDDQAFIPASFIEETLHMSLKEFCALPIEELYPLLLDCYQCEEGSSCMKHDSAYSQFLQDEVHLGAKWVMKDQVIVAVITLPYEV